MVYPKFSIFFLFHFLNVWTIVYILWKFQVTRCNSLFNIVIFKLDHFCTETIFSVQEWSIPKHGIDQRKTKHAFFLSKWYIQGHSDDEIPTKTLVYHMGNVDVYEYAYV